MEISEFTNFCVVTSVPGQGWYGEYGHISMRLDVYQGDGRGGRSLVKEAHDIRTVGKAREAFKEIVKDADFHSCPHCGLFDCNETCVSDMESEPAWEEWPDPCVLAKD